jgi:CRP-like cAMP-binding protein
MDVNDLKKFEIFSDLSDAQLQDLTRMIEKKRYSAQSHIYEHGDRAKYLFVVTSGLVSLREIQPDDPVGITFEMRERGEMFGAACFMKPREYTLTAVCLEDSEVLAIDADLLFELCERDAEMGYRLMTKLAQIYFNRYKIAKRQLREMVKAPTTITALPG